MPWENERKFLVTGDGWRSGQAGMRLRQGYLARGDVTVRVRIYGAGERASLTVKGRRLGISRLEFEYAIPVADALQVLRALCLQSRLEKTRYEVPHAGHVWQVDEYGGAHGGLVLAEIELREASELFDVPPWVGREVTGEEQYRNSSMAQIGAPLLDFTKAAERVPAQ